MERLDRLQLERALAASKSLYDQEQVQCEEEGYKYKEEIKFTNTEEMQFPVASTAVYVPPDETITILDDENTPLMTKEKTVVIRISDDYPDSGPSTRRTKTNKIVPSSKPTTTPGGYFTSLNSYKRALSEPKMIDTGAGVEPHLLTPAQYAEWKAQEGRRIERSAPLYEKLIQQEAERLKRLVAEAPTASPISPVREVPLVISTFADAGEVEGPEASPISPLF
jgi:hypothetical protein